MCLPPENMDEFLPFVYNCISLHMIQQPHQTHWRKWQRIFAQTSSSSSSSSTPESLGLEEGLLLLLLLLLWELHLQNPCKSICN
jgi:hypothetical protein